MRRYAPVSVELVQLYLILVIGTEGPSAEFYLEVQHFEVNDIVRS